MKFGVMKRAFNYSVSILAASFYTVKIKIVRFYTIILNRDTFNLKMDGIIE